MKRIAKTIIATLAANAALVSNLLGQDMPAFELTQEWSDKIEGLAPENAVVEPKQKRVVLVFNLITGFYHWNTPHTTEMVRILGEKSGAYDVVISDDPLYFEKEALAKFDAIALLNTCSKQPDRNLFYDALQDWDKAAELEANLIEHISNGAGLIGIHGGIVMQNKSEAFSETMGGSFDYHPKQTTVVGKILEHDHPISAAFKGKDLVHIDEPYCFNGAYSKFNFKPLMEMETPKLTEEAFSRSKEKLDRYIAWIRPHGKGRVFYCSPSHNAQSFENPDLLQFILNGIQYATGDLECDDTVMRP